MYPYNRYCPIVQTAAPLFPILDRTIMVRKKGVLQQSSPDCITHPVIYIYANAHGVVLQYTVVTTCMEYGDFSSFWTALAAEAPLLWNNDPVLGAVSGVRSRTFPHTVYPLGSSLPIQNGVSYDVLLSPSYAMNIDDSTVLGAYAVSSAVSMSGDVIIGYRAAQHMLTGNSNVYIGSEVAGGGTSGDANVYLGAGAGYSNSGNSNIFLGYGAAYNLTAASNTLFIGNNSDGFITGDMTGRTLTVSGDVYCRSIHVDASSVYIGTLKLSRSSTGGLTYTDPVANTSGTFYTQSFPPPGTLSNLYFGAPDRVGVNTASPATQLDVSGSVRVSSNIELSGALFVYTPSVTASHSNLASKYVITVSGSGTTNPPNIIFDPYNSNIATSFGLAQSMVVGRTNILMYRDTSFAQAVQVNGNASFLSNIVVTSNISAATLGLTQGLTANSLSITSNISAATLGVSGLAAFSSNLQVTSNISAATLGVSGLASFSSNIAVTSNISAATLGVSGLASFSSNIAVTSNISAATLGLTQGLTANSLSITSNISAATLGVTGLASFSSNIAVTSNISAATLGVSGLASFSSNIAVTSNISAATLGVSGLAAFSSNVSMSALLNASSAVFSCNLTVNGTFTHAGSVALQANSLNLCGFLTVSDYTILNVLTVSNNALFRTNVSAATLNVSGLASFSSNVGVTSNLSTGSLFVTNVTTLSGLTVSNIALMSSRLTVNGLGVFNSPVTINDITSLRSSVEVYNTLSVSGLASFSSNVNISAALSVSGQTLTSNLTSTGNGNFNTVNISGTSSNVGAASFLSNVSITGTLTGNGSNNLCNVNVSGAASFLSNVSITGTLTGTGSNNFSNVNVSGLLNVVTTVSTNQIYVGGNGNTGAGVAVNAAGSVQIGGNALYSGSNVVIGGNMSLTSSNLIIGGNMTLTASNLNFTSGNGVVTTSNIAATNISATTVLSVGSNNTFRNIPTTASYLLCNLVVAGAGGGTVSGAGLYGSAGGFINFATTTFNGIPLSNCREIRCLIGGDQPFDSNGLSALQDVSFNPAFKVSLQAPGNNIFTFFVTSTSGGTSMVDVFPTRTFYNGVTPSFTQFNHPFDAPLYQTSMYPSLHPGFQLRFYTTLGQCALDQAQTNIRVAFFPIF